MATLRVLDDPARACELGEDPVSIGRGKANTVALPGDPRASLRHAVVERTPRGWRLRDAGSTNGTWVNGERVDERLLADGDQLQVGQTLLVFEA